jgi:hypothetical protein
VKPGILPEEGCDDAKPSPVEKAVLAVTKFVNSDVKTDAAHDGRDFATRADIWL